MLHKGPRNSYPSDRGQVSLQRPMLLISQQILFPLGGFPVVYPITFKANCRRTGCIVTASTGNVLLHYSTNRRWSALLCSTNCFLVLHCSLSHIPTDPTWVQNTAQRLMGRAYFPEKPFLYGKFKKPTHKHTNTLQSCTL